MSSPQTSDDLYAMASCISICCQKGSDSFNEAKRVKKHPSQTVELRDNLMSCVHSVHTGLNSHCKDVFEQYKACQSKGKWSDCIDIQREVEKCAVKSKLGELAE